MMKIPRLLTALTALLLSCAVTRAATLATQVNWDSGSYTLRNVTNTAPITGGTAADHNGAVLQLGYFDSATTGNLFAGNWIPITGENSLNTAFNNTRVGDYTANGAADGSFAFSSGASPGTLFTQAVPTSFVALPPGGAFLAMRFYDNTTIGTSTFYETVANALWKWVSPASPTANVAISFDDAGGAGLRLQSTTLAPIGTNIRATLPNVTAPEPTSAALLMVGLVSLASRRRRTAKV